VVCKERISSSTNQSVLIKDNSLQTGTVTVVFVGCSFSQKAVVLLKTISVLLSSGDRSCQAMMDYIYKCVQPLIQNLRDTVVYLSVMSHLVLISACLGQQYQILGANSVSS
jgi:hypothetical protein